MGWGLAQVLHTVELAMPAAILSLCAGPVGAWQEPRGLRGLCG
jgi:hypothetical protein